MTAGVRVDVRALHKTIWDARDRRNLVQIHQIKFARFLGLSGPTLNRHLKNFEREGRIKKVGARRRNVGIYLVVDPAEFESGLKAP